MYFFNFTNVNLYKHRLYVLRIYICGLTVSILEIYIKRDIIIIKQYFKVQRGEMAGSESLHTNRVCGEGVKCERSNSR